MVMRVSPALEKLRQSTPVVAFDDLWLLFKLGDQVYWKFDLEQFHKIDLAAVVIRTELLMPHTKSDSTTLGREWYATQITRYEGERYVTSFPVYPSKYRDSQDGGKTRHALIERGRKAYQVLRNPKQTWYDGSTYTEKKKFIKVSRSAVKEAFHQFLENEITSQGVNTDMLDQTPSNFAFASFNHIALAGTPFLPTDDHYLLIVPIVAGFALYDKIWKLFCVEWLQEIEASMAMDSLIIDPVNREIIQAVCYTQLRPLQLDRAHNKGEGQVVLLHGPPGVGKTYIVECIAQWTGRPLIALAIGDLVHVGDGLEEQLIKWFTLAEYWKAILLLDEADIFLERRATRDIQRNGVVSIFLR
ncbi:MAG: hypothetical protein Q9190_004194 [Brigantiaea leucoxantha]